MTNFMSQKSSRKGKAADNENMKLFESNEDELSLVNKLKRMSCKVKNKNTSGESNIPNVNFNALHNAGSFIGKEFRKILNSDIVAGKSHHKTSKNAFRGITSTPKEKETIQMDLSNVIKVKKEFFNFSSKSDTGLKKNINSNSKSDENSKNFHFDERSFANIKLNSNYNLLIIPDDLNESLTVTPVPKNNETKVSQCSNLKRMHHLRVLPTPSRIPRPFKTVLSGNTVSDKTLKSESGREMRNKIRNALQKFSRSVESVLMKEDNTDAIKAMRLKHSCSYRKEKQISKKGYSNETPKRHSLCRTSSDPELSTTMRTGNKVPSYFKEWYMNSKLSDENSPHLKLTPSYPVNARYETFSTAKTSKKDTSTIYRSSSSHEGILGNKEEDFTKFIPKNENKKKSPLTISLRKCAKANSLHKDRRVVKSVQLQRPKEVKRPETGVFSRSHCSTPDNFIQKAEKFNSKIVKHFQNLTEINKNLKSALECRVLSEESDQKEENDLPTFSVDLEFKNEDYSFTSEALHLHKNETSTQDEICTIKSSKRRTELLPQRKRRCRRAFVFSFVCFALIFVISLFKMCEKCEPEQYIIHKHL